MEPKRVIVVAAVSDEFHAAPPELRNRFLSYRDVLRRAFRALTPHYEVVTQEELVVGAGDLLEILDQKVARSLIVVHLIGEMAGEAPPQGEVRTLWLRHADFLETEPELAQALRHSSGVAYAQWEAYFAVHHRKPCLVFKASARAPRSPLFQPTPAGRDCQDAHEERLRATGAHCAIFADQGDVARKAMRAFLHRRLDPDVDGIEPGQDAVGAAWASAEEIVRELADAIRKPDPRVVPVLDPANVAAFIGAVRVCAGRRKLNLATVLAIAAGHEDAVRAAAAERQTPDSLYQQAFAHLALGDFTAARFVARRAASIAIELRHTRPRDDVALRGSAVNALLLAHDAARGAHDVAAAIETLRDAAEQVDRNTERLLWVGIQEQLARFLLDRAMFAEASDVIDTVIDCREERQGEDHPDLGPALLLWANLLLGQANYAGCRSVAARAERLFARGPANPSAMWAAVNMQGLALDADQRFAEAAERLRHGLELAEVAVGGDRPIVATALNNLATVLVKIDRFNEAELLLWRSLAIDEANYGEDHPIIAQSLCNLAECLRDPDRASQAEQLRRRAMHILVVFEDRTGIEPPLLRSIRPS